MAQNVPQMHRHPSPATSVVQPTFIPYNSSDIITHIVNFVTMTTKLRNESSQNYILAQRSLFVRTYIYDDNDERRQALLKLNDCLIAVVVSDERAAAASKQATKPGAVFSHKNIRYTRGKTQNIVQSRSRHDDRSTVTLHMCI